MNKNLQKRPIYCFLMITLFSVVGTSCNKHNTDLNDISRGNLNDFNNSSVFLNGSKVEHSKGTLNFLDSEKFSEVVEEILEMRESELDKWEASIGFKSLRTVINEAHEDFGNLKTEAELNKWHEKYKDVVELKDSTVTEHISNRLSKILSNRSGEYRVGEALVKSFSDKE